MHGKVETISRRKMDDDIQLFTTMMKKDFSIGYKNFLYSINHSSFHQIFTSKGN